MEQKKKILFIAEAMGGGVFTYTVDLVNALSEQYDVTIAYAVRPQTPADFKTYFNESVQLLQVKNFTRNIDLVKDFLAFFEIRKIAKQASPDIIHLHSSKAGVLGRLAFWFSKTPLFYTPHGYSFLMQEMSIKKRKIYRFIEQIMALSKCTTISCSEGEHQETLKLTSRAKFVNNGINIEKLDKDLSLIENISDSSIVTVFTLGRICYQKNPALFNEIAEQLPDVRFLWIGDGERKNELTAPNIKVTGWIDRHKALKCAMSADIFLLTSRWEGLPMSLLEAMYMNKPCIVSDIIGNHDVIHNEQNGMVCRTPSEFVRAIRIMKDNAKFREQCCKQAYLDVLEEYNTVVMAEKYAKIYEN